MSQSESLSRRWTRHNVDVRLKVLLEHGGKSVPAFGRGSSLSEGGMGAYIPRALALGAMLQLQMTFPYSTTKVSLRAVVRSSEGFHYGLEFVNVPEHVRVEIMKNCDSAAMQ